MRPVLPAVVALVVVLLTLAAAPPPPVLPVARPVPYWMTDCGDKTGRSGADVAISPGGHLVAAAVRRQVQVYARASGTLLYTLGEAQQVRGIGFVEDHLLLTTTFLRQPFGQVVAARLSWWDLRTRKKIRSIDYDSDLGSPLFSPNRKLMLLGSGKQIDWEVAVRESATGQLVRELRLDGYGGVAFTPDSKGLLVGYRSGLVSRFDLATGASALVCRVDTRDSPLVAVAVAPDGRTLATAGGGYLTLFDLPAGKLRGRLELRGVQYCGLTFVREGRALLACCYGWIVLIDTRTAQRARRDMQVCWSLIRGWSVSADSRWLATIGPCDEPLRLWKLAEW